MCTFTHGVSMGLLNVSKQQWEIAQTYFAANNEAKKFSKANKAAGNFSFIKVNGEIYAMANTRVNAYLGTGGFAKVKLVETQDGSNFAVKIEGKGIDHRSLKEVEVMKVLDKHIGIMERNLAEVQNFWRKDKDKKPLMTGKKSYQIVVLEHGKELFDLLHHNTNPLTAIQKIQFAIKICQALRHIHQRGIIHADIKPENILVAINADQIEVTILDFGFSIQLPKGQTSIKDEPKGTNGFIAPEIYNKDAPRSSQCEFSFASDIYALGMMFKNHFGFVGTLFDDATHDDPLKRPSLDIIETALTKLLETKQRLAKPLARPLPVPPTMLDVVTPLVTPTKQSGALFIAKLEAILAKPKPVHETMQPIIVHSAKQPRIVAFCRAQQNKIAPMQQLNADLKNKLAQRQGSPFENEGANTNQIK